MATEYGIKHTSVGTVLSRTEWEAEDNHEIEFIIIPDGAGAYLQLPKLTTTQRDALTPVEGMVIYNSTTTQIEAYESGSWGAIAGAVGAHASDHENGGADEISVAGLSGELADDQPPKAHKTDHQNGGGDEIDVGGLSGELADDQPPKAHKTDHENGGGDEISVAGLSGELADDQPPKAHEAEHQAGGGDILYVPRTLIWYIDGNVATGTEQGATYRLKRAAIVEDVELHVKTAPTGAALIVDINEAGGTIFSTNPEIDISGTVEDDNHVISDSALAAGAEITMDIDQVGSTVPGADLTVQLHIKEAVI